MDNLNLNIFELSLSVFSKRHACHLLEQDTMAYIYQRVFRITIDSCAWNQQEIGDIY